MSYITTIFMCCPQFKATRTCHTCEGSGGMEARNIDGWAECGTCWGHGRLDLPRRMVRLRLPATPKHCLVPWQHPGLAAVAA